MIFLLSASRCSPFAPALSPPCAGLSNHDLAEMAGWKHGVLTFFVRAMAGLPEQPEPMAS